MADAKAARGTPADTVWDLAEGFAILARNAAAHPLYRGDAQALHEISTRLKARAEGAYRTKAAERLEGAIDKLHHQK
jgi:hypothetical protein